MQTLSLGQKFHYTGDMANDPDEGKITEVLERTAYAPLRYRAKMISGKVKIIEAYAFEKSIGQRFKTVEQVEEERQEKIRKMNEYYAKIKSE